MLDIGAQLCVEMCIIITYILMHVNEQEDWQFKV